MKVCTTWAKYKHNMGTSPLAISISNRTKSTPRDTSPAIPMRESPAADSLPVPKSIHPAKDMKTSESEQKA